jgi:hypothetical protein
MLPTQTAPSPGAAAQPTLPDAVKHFVVQRMVRRDPPARIADLVEQNFHIKVAPEQMLACWYEKNPPSTQTERRQDKESVQLPADQVGEPLFTRMPCAETPDAAPPGAITRAAPATRTGPGQEKSSTQIPTAAANLQAETDHLQEHRRGAERNMPPTRTGPGQKKESEQDDLEDVILPTEVREFIIGRMARREAPWWIAKEVERNFGFVVDCDEIIVCWRDRDAFPTRTGPGQEKESMPKLSDEIKEFIVKRIACYETPSRIAAAVRINFGIDVDRRRIFDYDPAGSRPPAQRWIDLHAVTRARFLRDVA